MSNAQYNLQFQKLCNVLQLGDMIEEPKAISGGLLHRMYSVETSKGKYAIKALNPKIMLRPTAMQSFIRSELIVDVVANNIPAIPAKKFNSTSIQKMDNQYYLVFDWLDGRSLKSNEINKEHCEKIGDILASIHRMDFSALGISNNHSSSIKPIDWNYYLNKGKEKNAEWLALMGEVIDNLYEWNIQANKSSKLLSENMVISHRDLDSKNVMWNGENPYIIDWESAGYVNPMQELVETAIYWSETKSGSIDKERFSALICAYKKRYGTLQADWKAVLQNGFAGKLDWLEYSLKRSLWIECTDEAEQKMGTEQVTGTINSIRRYADMIYELEKWLNDEVNN